MATIPLRVARLRAGLSQDELALTSGVSQSTISRMESGHANPTLRAVVRLAKALGRRPGDIHFGMGGR